MSRRQARNLRLASILFALIVTVLAGPVFGPEGLVPVLAADALSLGGGLLLLAAFGHCDTLDGPVIGLARKALETRNVNLVLPWVRAEDEPEIRHAFDHALAVRKLGAEARSLADQHFFETLVRIHRASEGAPYTGLKPAGLDLGPAVPAADKALEDGSIDKVVQLITDAVREGVRRHFHAAYHRRKFDANDVAAGRDYVAAYVPYVHYVEGLWDAATGATGHHHAAEAGPGAAHAGHHAH
ncbi:MAG: DUF6448 family protein [Bacteroidota bacterium]|jgi:hypothetical protein